MSSIRLLLPLCVVAVIAAGVHAADIVDDADLATRLGFSGGAAPLVVTPANGGSLSARGCAACHADVAADWATTRHAAAWSNPVFLDGFAREPLPRCVHCHAPLVQQKLEAGPVSIAAPRRRSSSSKPSATSLLHEGITCVVCHVRDGAVLIADDVVRTDNTPMHPITVERGLKDPAFCAACHQFGFSASDVVMQGTFSEWQRYAGGVGKDRGETCQSCHMPKGRHLFRGAWDVELLKRSLHVDDNDDHRLGGAGRWLVLRSVEVGHHFPTGDLFRHLTVEVADDAVAADDDDDDDDRWREVFRIGRRFGGEGLDKHVVEDTSLVPGVPRRVAIPHGVAWRVRYHYAEDRHERAGVVAPVVIAASR